jgi:hypothetical protein
VIVTQPLPQINLPKVFPLWAAQELHESLVRLEGSRLLISRSGERILKISSPSGKKWDIDNDIIWRLYPLFLKTEGKELRHMITGVSVIWQTAIILMLASMLGLEPIDSVRCLPKVYFQPVNGVRTLEEAVSRFGPGIVSNALLWASLSEKKKITLSGSLFPCMKEDFPQVSSLVSSRNKLRYR